MTDTLPTLQKEKIGFVHLGCPKNLVDTETMLGVLTDAGHQIVADEQDASVVLVNTCAFLESAQRESVRHLVQLAEQGKKLLVTGCLAQKFQDELLDVLPEAGAVIGTGNLLEVDSILRRVQQGERVVAIQQDPTFILEDDTRRRHITVGASVYVKIAEGCDYRCSFCIIPSMRGDFRSRSLESLVTSVRELVERGATEVVLVGQDTTSYGKDINSSLPRLLRALNDIEGLQWLRFMYAYPNLVSDDLLAAIRDCDKLVKYMDCPLQHTHPDILKRMRRPVMDHAAFAQRVRDAVPGIRMRTSFIVGFPGETDEHYHHLKQTIETVKWDRMGVFEYSDVDTAHSQTLDGKVPKKLIQQRRSELMALQQGISYAYNQQLIGQTLPVLIDSISPTGLRMGRTQWDAPEVDNAVLVKGTAMPGDIVQVAITHATPYDIKGTQQD
jgi:ribosomal protein S12 methylthiotransferase